MKIETVALDYIKRHRARARAEMRRFAVLRSLREAIREASLCCLPNGNRHPHQYRIPANALVRAELALQKMATDIAASGKFDDLHSVVWAAIKPIRGIGELTIYDIAHRIGAFLRLKPELVYLHRGTREGAKAFGLSGKAIRPDQLPSTLADLTAAELEDCLCIYKAHFMSCSGRQTRKRGSNAIRVRTARCPAFPTAATRCSPARSCQ